MALTNNLRAGLHRKSWEQLNNAPAASASGSFIATADAKGISERMYMVFGASSIWQYLPTEDAFIQLPNSGVAGTFGAGSCGEAMGIGMLGGSSTSTATAGTTTTITTNRTIVRQLTGAKVRVLSGAGIGYVGEVVSNTIGANSVLTVTPASATAFGITTVFEIYSGSLWFFNAGTTAVGFSVYDRATNAWTAKSVTGLPTAWGTCGQLISTRSSVMTAETGTAIAGATTTTLPTTKNWGTNCWANYQVEITGGTGIGQIRTIASNTATTLTVSAAWTTNPDATSTFQIVGNDDYIYLLGNGAVTLYRYTISTNTWATITPGTARAAAISNGGTADWIGNIEGVPLGQFSPSTFNGVLQKGRFIYSLRGNGANVLDVYDIAENKWFTISYGNQNETFTTGSYSCYDQNRRIYIAKESTGRYYYLDVIENALKPFTQNSFPSSTAVAQDGLAIYSYTEAGTTVDFIYTMLNTSSYFWRTLVVK